MWNRKGGKEKCPVDTFPDAARRFHLGPPKKDSEAIFFWFDGPNKLIRKKIVNMPKANVLLKIG